VISVLFLEIERSRISSHNCIVALITAIPDKIVSLLRRCGGITPQRLTRKSSLHLGQSIVQKKNITRSKF
jgi:hypothetical protein